LNMTRARRCGLVAAQAGWAALAASIAFWRSAAVPSRTWAWTWPWLGSNTSPCRSPEAKVEPPTKWSIVRNMKRVLAGVIECRRATRPGKTQMPVARAEERESRDAEIGCREQCLTGRRGASAVAGREAARDRRTGRR